MSAALLPHAARPPACRAYTPSLLASPTPANALVLQLCLPCLHAEPAGIPLFPADALVNQLNFPQTTCQLQCTDPSASGLSVPMLQLSNPPYWIANGLTADALTTSVSVAPGVGRWAVSCFARTPVPDVVSAPPASLYSVNTVSSCILM